VRKLYTDDGLAFCGNATQWSDFRSGTRGDVKMKWPTELLWKSAKFSKRYQHQSCNHYCNKEIGPVCRENFDSNIRWLLAKGNQTSKIECFPSHNLQQHDLNNNNKDIKYAYRECRVQTNQKKALNQKLVENPLRDYSYANFYFQTAAWMRPNVDECVQTPLLKLKKEVISFIKTDNFDDAKIFVYLDRLHELANDVLSVLPQKSIYDVAYIIDIIFYLTDALV